MRGTHDTPWGGGIIALRGPTAGAELEVRLTNTSLGISEQPSKVKCPSCNKAYNNHTLMYPVR